MCFHPLFIQRRLYKIKKCSVWLQLPKALLTKLHLSNLNVYVRGTNLLTFVKDKNLPFDPEAGIDSDGNLNVFMPKTVTAGLRVSL